MEKKFLTTSKEETMALGEKLAPLFEPGDVVLLEGDLGAGKTTLVKGVGEALGVKSEIKSPTFNIMYEYFDGSLPLYHIDAYRLEGQNTELGLDEAIEGDGVCFVEWPQFIEKLLPDELLKISLKNVGGDEREITLESIGGHYDELLGKLEGEEKA